MPKSIAEMLKEETTAEYFDRQMKKSENLRKIKKKNYINQLESMSKEEYNLFMEAVDEVQKEQKR